MARKKSTSTPEFREMAVKEVIDHSRPIVDVASEMGIVEQTLGNWVKKYREAHAADEPEMSLPDRARLKELDMKLVRCADNFWSCCTAPAPMPTRSGAVLAPMGLRVSVEKTKVCHIDEGCDQILAKAKRTTTINSGH